VATKTAAFHDQYGRQEEQALYVGSTASEHDISAAKAEPEARIIADGGRLFVAPSMGELLPASISSSEGNLSAMTAVSIYGRMWKLERERGERRERID